MTKEKTDGRETSALRRRPAWMGVVALAVVAAVLGGCRESEQDRPLKYEPGVFKGENRDASGLTPEQTEKLRERVRDQKGVGL